MPALLNQLLNATTLASDMAQTVSTSTLPPTTMAASTSSPVSTVATAIVENVTTVASNVIHSAMAQKQTFLQDDPSVFVTSTSPSVSTLTMYDYVVFRLPDFNQLPTSMVVLLAIALIFILWATLKFIQAVWIYFGCYLLGFGAKWEPGPDSWAIVTGSTDGIGLSYAKAMARKGYCLLLISRTQAKLERVKAQILNEYPNCPEVRLMAIDFTLDNIYKQIANEIAHLPGHVHVLINNVGMAYKYPEYFTKIPNSDKFISDILNCNILSVTRMTHIVLPLMEKRRSGIIINISSYSALFPTPLLALYSASKIYMDYFSRALTAEYARKGIIVQSVLPYYVSTNMIRNPGISFMIPSSDQFVNSALKTVGVETRTYGYFAHNILAFFQNFFVKFVIGNNLNTKIAFKRMKAFRKGCYKRKGLAHKF